jgi:hypothetical protein
VARLSLPETVEDVLDLDISDQSSRKTQLEGVGKDADESRLGRHYPDERLPTIITTAAHLLENRDDQKERRVIQCWANPSTVDWTAARRESFQKVKAGSIRYSWRKRGHTKGTGAGSGDDNASRETYYDELQIRFTFQSGNILSLPGSLNYIDVPPGLDDFYLFLGLLNEAKLLDDGRENWHVVIHTSPVFPTIFLKGWFTPDGVTWAESADSGFGLQWQATMEVHQTIPAIHDPSALRKMFGSVF